MMRIYIKGYRGAGFGGGLIKWFTFGGISHVSLVFVHRDKPIEEIEAIQGKGVHRKDFFTPSNAVLYRVPCTAAQAERIYAEALDQIGKKYDWAGIYGFLRRRCREQPGKWFCSELVAHCLAVGGFELMRLPAWKQTPVIVCASPMIELVDSNELTDNPTCL